MNKALDLLVIGGSAGSLSMVVKIVPLLKRESSFAIVVVFHRNQTDENLLLDVLSGKTAYAVKEAEDKDDIQPGVIYVAPPNYHLLVEKDKTLTLDDSEKVNHSRPSIDVTFESAAEAYGPKLVCLLLSGANADGVQGLVTARAAGARVVVQDPADALVPFMPQEAVARVAVDMLVHRHNVDAFLHWLG